VAALDDMGSVGLSTRYTVCWICDSNRFSLIKWTKHVSVVGGFAGRVRSACDALNKISELFASSSTSRGN
jgi:hypothetical protein